MKVVMFKKSNGDTPVRGVKYTCGCVSGSDRDFPARFAPSECVHHKNPIDYYYAKYEDKR